MENFVTKLLNKFTQIKYLSIWAVLFMDMCISVVGTLCSILLVNFATNTDYIPMASTALLFAATIATAMASFLILRTYRKAIRHSTIGDLALFGIASMFKCIVGYMALYFLDVESYGERYLFYVGLCDFALTFLFLIAVRAVMVFAYDNLNRYYKDKTGNVLKKVLVYGTSDKSTSLITRLQKSSHFKIAGFLDYGRKNASFSIADLEVYYFTNAENVITLKEVLGLDGLLFAKAADAQNERSRLVDFALKAGLSIFFAPEIDEIQDGNVNAQLVRQVNIEDLLGRPEIKINMERIHADVAGKVIMVTGAAGSIGSELCRQIAAMDIRQLILFDNAETPMHNLRLELGNTFKELNFVPVIGDVRQEPRLDYAFRKFRPQIVFHAAAYKHVPLMEENPCEAVLVNTVGSRQVADKCIQYGVEKMVMISTDKAVNPTNIMGCTKRLAEVYVQSLGLAVQRGEVKGNTQFVTTRFGNVLGSNGSVIPLFRSQIATGGPVTVTDPNITRFFMTIPEACRLVMEAATLGAANQIFVFDMGKPVRILDMAIRMIELAGLRPGADIKIKFTGLRPGEKLYEEVLATAENTLPTIHDRIRIAKVREYDHAEAAKAVDRLEELSRAVDIPQMVRYMKELIPEYLSHNSRFEEFDKKN